MTTLADTLVTQQAKVMRLKARAQRFERWRLAAEARGDQVGGKRNYIRAISARIAVNVAERQVRRTIALDRQTLSVQPPADRITSPRLNVGAARRAIRKARSMGEHVPEAPTPERFIQAESQGRLERFSEVVERSRNGKIETAFITKSRFRVDAGPLERLRDRNLLAPHDAASNTALAEAGTWYRTTWLSAGLNRLAAMDPSKPPVSSSTGPRMLWSSERAANAFQAFCVARDTIGSSARPVIENVILAERELAEIGRIVSGYVNRAQASAIALHLLRCGLADLARHRGLLTASTHMCILGASSVGVPGTRNTPHSPTKPAGATHVRA